MGAEFPAQVRAPSSRRASAEGRPCLAKPTGLPGSTRGMMKATGAFEGIFRSSPGPPEADRVASSVCCLPGSVSLRASPCAAKTGQRRILVRKGRVDPGVGKRPVLPVCVNTTTLRLRSQSHEGGQLRLVLAFPGGPAQVSRRTAPPSPVVPWYSSAGITLRPNQRNCAATLREVFPDHCGVLQYPDLGVGGTSRTLSSTTASSAKA